MTVKRDIGKQFLEAISSIKEGQGRQYKIETSVDVRCIRENLHLSQSVFTSLMGVSMLTLQEWEQGRRKPSGADNSLLKIAQQYPEIFTHLS